MIIRKFIAKTENEATAAAKKELGEGMVIMNVRYVKPKGPFSFLKKKQVELTAAKEDDEEPIRQIRKIAKAQEEARKKEKEQALAGSSAPASENKEKSESGKNFDVSVGDQTKIEKKLDDLQSLLETQLKRENAVLKASEASAEKAAKATVKKTKAVTQNSLKSRKKK